MNVIRSNFIGKVQKNKFAFQGTLSLQPEATTRR